MQTALADTVAELEARARAAQEAENAFRRHAADEIVRLEQARVFAFRRKEFSATLLREAAGAKSEEEAVAALQNALAQEFDWDQSAERLKPMLAKFAGVSRAVWRDLHGAHDGGSFVAELIEFERWYEEQHGKAFWSLFDVYMPETPLVDF